MPASAVPPGGRPRPAAATDAEHDSGLLARLARAEAALEALQDQVYRESERRDREIAELRRQLRPETLARNLSDDTRRRGL